MTGDYRLVHQVDSVQIVEPELVVASSEDVDKVFEVHHAVVGQLW